MRKTTIELTDEQYFHLLEKALEFKKKDKYASMGSLIRELIDKDIKAAKRKAGK